MAKSYHEMCLLSEFLDRFNYLKINQKVGDATFGSHRYLNQILYRMPEWKSVRSKVIVRDNGCDLGVSGYEINGQSVYVHHIDPITMEDITNNYKKVFDMDNLITVSFATHQAIHYGDGKILSKTPIERRLFDTCPWKG